MGFYAGARRNGSPHGCSIRPLGDLVQMPFPRAPPPLAAPRRTLGVRSTCPQIGRMASACTRAGTARERCRAQGTAGRQGAYAFDWASQLKNPARSSSTALSMPLPWNQDMAAAAACPCFASRAPAARARVRQPGCPGGTGNVAPIYRRTLPCISKIGKKKNASIFGYANTQKGWLCTQGQTFCWG